MKKSILNGTTAICLICLFIISFISVAFDTSVAFAADVGDAISYTYDSTDVMEDLEGSDGFDVKEYPANKLGTLQIITFLEYGYSKAWNHYGLYIYIYNPQQRNLSRSSANNKVNVAVEFNENDEATKYSRLNLVFCSASEDRLFYKYRIDDSTHALLELARAYAETHEGKRRYDISNVEISVYGSNTACSTEIGKSYECTGYMKGFGDDKTANTFACKAYSIDVLDIELKHTFFRPEGNKVQSSEYTVKDQLDSVYFSFPNNLIEYYGGIWKIAASYYHAQTSPILVTSNKAVYDVVKQYLGQELDANNDKKGKDEKLNNNIPFVLYDVTYTDDLLAPLRPINCRLDWNHNAKYNPVSKDEQIVYYLFYTGNETSDGSIPLAKDFTLSGERLLEYIYDYDSSYRFGKSELENDKQQRLSMDLFQGYLETGETMEWFDTNAKIEEAGMMYYVPIEITAEDNYTIESYKRTPTAYDWFKLFKGKYDYEVFSNIQAIEPIDENDINLAKDAFCKKYYVDASAYDDIIAQMRAGKGKETIYLFRFAQSTYTAKGVLTRGVTTLSEEHAYVAEQDVYLNMNIASITCRKGDVYHTFAVCSNPINAVADAEPNVPYDNAQYYEDLWEKIKSWFEKNAAMLIAIVTSLIVVIICVLIMVLAIKLALAISATTQRKITNNSPPNVSGKQRKRRTKEPRKQQKHTTIKKVGRRKKQ